MQNSFLLVVQWDLGRWRLSFSFYNWWMPSIWRYGTHSMCPIHGLGCCDSRPCRGYSCGSPFRAGRLPVVMLLLLQERCMCCLLQSVLYCLVSHFRGFFSWFSLYLCWSLERFGTTRWDAWSICVHTELAVIRTRSKRMWMKKRKMKLKLTILISRLFNKCDRFRCVCTLTLTNLCRINFVIRVAECVIQ